VARGESMKRLFAQARAVADADRPVLLLGESGTGKELLAEAIHQASRRCERPFVRFDCGSVPAATLEGELFGRDPAPFEQADGGTLLLENVEDLPLELQARLLGVIEMRQFDRPGGDPPVRTDVRLICAVKRELSALVKEGRFREDLYYRLNAIALAIPPLRERPADIPALVRHFVAKHASLAGGGEIAVEPAAMDELMRHRWPGNVRELEHAVERALAFCDGVIRPEHVLPLAGGGGEQAPHAAIGETGDGTPLGLNETVADIERRMILMALRQCEGNQARAAQRLGIPRTTLRDKMARYSIPAG
jgi:DNA-binding NtrC family response regulator